MINTVLWDAMLIVLWLVASIVVDAILAIPFALDAIGPQSRFETVMTFVIGVMWFSTFPALVLFGLVVPAWNRGF
jgi:hypothetical protein